MKAKRFEKLKTALKQAKAGSRDPARAHFGGGMVEAQDAFSGARGTYGPWGGIAQNACGSIAAHNICVMTGRGAPYARAYLWFRARWPWATLLGGALGTNPAAVKAYLRRRGLRVTAYKKPGGVPKTHGAYLALYVWKNKRLGAHYAAVGYDETTGRFAAHNDGAGEFAAFARMKEKDRAVWMRVWGVDGPADKEP